MKLKGLGIILLALCILFGCKKGADDYTEGLTEEQTAILEFVSEISDRSTRADFKDLFTTAPNASELKKYQEFSFSALDPIEVNGNSATAQVEIVKYGGDDPASTKTWKFSKSGETWKIDAAPL
ncbi:MAG: hypothetical protein KDB27_31080 [Planctomycetales bacterium]|nr:hypothetical protein [Planctomycetales bacterium]